MRLSAISNRPDIVTARQCSTPDHALKYGTEMHSFAFSPQGQLVIDPVAGRGHDQYDGFRQLDHFNNDDDFGCMYGRYGKFRSVPVICTWEDFCPDYLLKPCLTALLSKVPPETIVCGGEEPLPLSDIIRRPTGLRRDAEYRARRNTSEGQEQSRSRA